MGRFPAPLPGVHMQCSNWEFPICHCKSVFNENLVWYCFLARPCWSWPEERRLVSTASCFALLHVSNCKGWDLLAAPVLTDDTEPWGLCLGACVAARCCDLATSKVTVQWKDKRTQSAFLCGKLDSLWTNVWPPSACCPVPSVSLSRYPFHGQIGGFVYAQTRTGLVKPMQKLK